MKTIIYKQNKHYTLKADLYEANQQEAPVIIYIHGGGLLWGTRKEISKEMIQLYTDSGFSLFSIDYRLAPETKLPDILHDIQDAIKWIQTEGVKHFSINPQKMAVVGGSAGGFLALSTGTFENKPKAIVSFYGYSDLNAAWAIKPSQHYRQKEIIPEKIAKQFISKSTITEGPIQKRYLLYLYARQTGEWVEEITGISPNLNQRELTLYSPIYHIQEDYPATLLLHGTADTDVPYEQSVLTRDTLVNKGIDAELITITNGEHVFDKEFNRPIVQDALKQVIQFLHTRLNG
ncbi:Carboxylesterase LipF [Paraliobacillus sp. PM-2]|uniref:alpha/beta hydrolase n=1 Tax=Paraliobacillus sp. PM-2 TaxID=1462524 RepID=UPI00061C9774|nr:alpha/beta hydrolase [Paraliobacillus sp. PM-2]CQR45929.1 Carboxylesterase LipF [Paraliobacillus sp. PM-2]